MVGAIATRDANGVLHLWELPSGRLLGRRPLDGNGVSRYSPDGRMVAAAANLGVRLLDGATLAPLPAGYLRHPDSVSDLAFSPDGAFLLTAHETGNAQLWDVATRKPVGPPAVLSGPIRAVTFTPDGTTCVCVAADGTVRRWPVPAPFVEADLDRLAERVALLTGQRMDDNQGLDSVPGDEWRALRQELAGDGSTALVPPRPDADWHDAVAADAEQDEDAFGAQWHLDRLAALRPQDWTIPARRGRVLAATGRRDEADVAYAQARRLAPSPQVLADWLRAAAVDDDAAGQKPSALWNLERAIALTPVDWTLYALRANLVDSGRAVADEDEAIRLGAELPVIERAADRAAGSGDWKRSAALFTTLARNTDLPMSARYFQAVACAKAGDAVGYRAACAGDGRAAAAGRTEDVAPRVEQRSTGGHASSQCHQRLDQNPGLDRARPDPARRDREGKTEPEGLDPTRTAQVLKYARGSPVPGRPVRGSVQSAPGGDERPLRRERTSQHTIPCPRRSPARPHGRRARSGGRGKKSACRAQAGERLGAGRDGIAGCGAECRPAASLNVNTTEPRRSTLVITGRVRVPR